MYTIGKVTNDGEKNHADGDEKMPFTLKTVDTIQVHLTVLRHAA